jgi:uncharacterized protein
MISIINRPFWLSILAKSWEKRPLIWLHGVRQIGKTSLSKMLENSLYLNCDLPSAQRRLADPESFYETIEKGTVVVFDEIHRLGDPSMILKIGADEYPGLKILATGSSTLEATKKFKDSLTGRKTSVYLPPVLWDESREEFGIKDLDRRLLQGGLPAALLSDRPDLLFYSEWINSFFARDIQELFNIRNREGYIRLMNLLYRSSGNLIEYGQLAKLSGLSRPTVSAYIETLKIADNVYILPPYYGGGKREITARPKCYAFDTGIVAFTKGWNDIREEDRGILWEHLVLDELRAYYPERKVYYWRDKSNREIDFVIPGNDGKVDIYECKINPDRFSINPVSVFRGIYPEGKNYCICPFIKDSYITNIQGYKIEFSGSVKSTTSDK